MTTITMKEVAAFLLGEDSLDGYWFGERHPISPFWWREHLRAALSAPATAPAWHVAPTVPGLWLNSVFMKVEDVEQWHIDCQLHLECARWYGPIPPDGDKP